MHQAGIRKALAVTGVAAIFAGCAGQPERPVAELSRATTLIEQAERNDAARLAAADLEQARGKLSRAEAAAEAGEQEASLRLAREAAVDAELAQARASAAEARKSAEELERSLQTLREESARRPDAGGAGEP